MSHCHDKQHGTWSKHHQQQKQRPNKINASKTGIPSPISPAVSPYIHMYIHACTPTSPDHLQASHLNHMLTNFPQQGSTFASALPHPPVHHPARLFPFHIPIHIPNLHSYLTLTPPRPRGGKDPPRT